jgi:predicted GIY-YIG superfamily endonuclease
MKQITGTVYLLHFDRPFRHAKHYMGWAEDSHWMERVEQHKRGQGAKLMQYVVAAGIGFCLARVWEGRTRHDERRWKSRGKGRLCPVCREGGGNECNPG